MAYIGVAVQCVDYPDGIIPMANEWGIRAFGERLASTKTNGDIAVRRCDLCFLYAESGLFAYCDQGYRVEVVNMRFVKPVTGVPPRVFNI